MPQYRRARGNAFFFTVVLADRSSTLLVNRADRLRRIYHTVQQRRPFETVAICILPDHLHAIWSLPEDDADFSSRWNLIKGGFSRGLEAQMRSISKSRKREKGIWQRRYWEHAIRDDADLARHVDYIHFNPVKHGLVTRVRDWSLSSFHRYVDQGTLPVDWGGTCGIWRGSSENDGGHGARRARLCPPYEISLVYPPNGYRRAGKAKRAHHL
nr:transposase [Bradyrhizobium sp. 139]